MIWTTSRRSLQLSTADRARPSDGKRRPRLSTPCCDQRRLALRRPVETEQFTGEVFTGVLTSNGIRISMDGKGAWRDNVFVERLWRSVKYEEVYLRAYSTVAEARASIGRYLDFYNTRRPHSSLDRRTPDRTYFTKLPQIAAA